MSKIILKGFILFPQSEPELVKKELKIQNGVKQLQM